MKLAECIEQYIGMKKAAGFSFDSSAPRLRAFVRMAGDLPMDTVTETMVIRYLNSPNNSKSGWQTKYGLLKYFFEYWEHRLPMRSIPLPKNRGRAIPRMNRCPHIYSPQQVSRLLIATEQLRAEQGFAIEPHTFRVFLLLLYGTGCSVGEARRLRRSSVDLRRGTIVFQKPRYGRARKIPVCRYLLGELRRYAPRRQAQALRTEQAFFITRRGTSLRPTTVTQTFDFVRQLAKIHSSTVRNPTMQDFRPTFAVQRLSEWHEDEMDLNKMVPALAGYMGLTEIRAIERYLSLTPDRFGRQLNALSPQRPLRHWRDDQCLLKFLTAI